MKVKELIKQLSEMDEEMEICVSSDEELNCVFEKFEICEIENNCYCIFGLSGSEKE